MQGCVLGLGRRPGSALQPTCCTQHVPSSLWASVSLGPPSGPPGTLVLLPELVALWLGWQSWGPLLRQWQGGRVPAG